MAIGAAAFSFIHNFLFGNADEMFNCAMTTPRILQMLKNQHTSLRHYMYRLCYVHSQELEKKKEKTT
eukprot:1146636-Pelagomonas_calceolata.AAC.7